MTPVDLWESNDVRLSCFLTDMLFVFLRIENLINPHKNKKHAAKVNIEHIRKRSTENLKIKTSEKPLGNLEPFKNLLGEPGTFQEPPSKPPRFLFLSHF